MKLFLLGSPHLELDEDIQYLGCKPAGLLAYLALEGTTRRVHLSDLLWPDLKSAAARNNLRQKIHELRRDGTIL